MGTRRRAASSAKPKQKPRGKSFEAGNQWRWPPGQSGNPSGQPAVLQRAYKAWLELPYKHDKTMTNAHALAMAQGDAALKGDTQAAREIRQATEGDMTFTKTDVNAPNLESVVAMLQAATKLREGGHGKPAADAKP